MRLVNQPVHEIYIQRRASLSFSLFAYPSDFVLAAWWVCSIESRSYSDSHSNMQWIQICSDLHTKHTHGEHRNLSVCLPPSLSLTHTQTQKTHMKYCWLSHSPEADVTGWMGASKGKLKQTQSSAEASDASGRRWQKSMSILSSLLNGYFLTIFFSINQSINQTVIWNYFCFIAALTKR